MSVLCIDFGGTDVKIGELEGATTIARTLLPNGGDRQILDDVESAAHSFEGRWRSIGIALPGIVRRDASTLVAAPAKYSWAIGFDFGDWAERVFGAPVIVENDARAAVWGEATLGVARGRSSMVMMTLGTGIGTASILEDRLVRGGSDHAGVLGGHMSVDLDGPDCPCGNVGCAEAIASTWALRRDVADDPALQSALRRSSLDVGLRDLILHREHPDVAGYFDRYVQAWAASLVGLCHAYDPDVVIVSGGVMRSSSVLLPELTRRVHAHLWSSARRPDLIVPKSPENSVVLGLSALGAPVASLAQGRASSDQRVDVR